MKTAQLFTLLTLGATLILAPGTERVANADRDSRPVFKEHSDKHNDRDGRDKEKYDKHDKYDKRHENQSDSTHENRRAHPVFAEHPGKHKGWDKHDKVEKYETHDRRYDHVADTRHEHLYPRTVTRTSTGYWHSHDGYPRHFHYYRRPAPVSPHQHVRREVVVVDKRAPLYKPESRKDYKVVRDTRNEIRDGREQLRKQNTELQKDRAELRRDIRNGASKDEIRKDRKEIRDGYAQIRKTREELAQDQARLDSMRRK